MSSHHSRNQQRRQQFGSSTQTFQNTPTTPPKTFAKGIVIPLVINLVLCIALCIGKSLVNKHTSIHLPTRTIPLIILASVLVAIYIVVSYVIKQYKYLKGTYQNLEQGMAAAAVLNAQQGDYVEYPVGTPYYGNNTMYNQYNQIPPTVPTVPQTSSTQTANNRQKSNLWCGLTLFIFILLSLVSFAYLYTSGSFSDIDMSSSRPVQASITSIEKQIHTYTTVEDGSESIEQYSDYAIEYKYSYNGTEYNGKGVSPFSLKKGDTVFVIVNTTTPQNSFFPGEQLLAIFIVLPCVVLAALVIFLTCLKKRH